MSIDKSILVLDDEEEFAKLFQEALQDKSYHCVVAFSKEQAIAALEAQSFDCIFSDMRLGADHNGGMDVLRVSRSKAVPCIIMTAFADLEVVKTALNEGASYLVEKPFEFDEMIDVMNRIIDPEKRFGPLVEAFFKDKKLTEKEQEISRYLLKGLPNKEIAELTNNTEKTIKFHLTSIFRKSSVRNRTELLSAILKLR